MGSGTASFCSTSRSYAAALCMGLPGGRRVPREAALAKGLAPRRTYRAAAAEVDTNVMLRASLLHSHQCAGGALLH